MNVVVGVSGSVAAYKAVSLVRLLLKQGMRVRVAMTRSASRFVGESTFAGLTGEAPLIDLFEGAGEPHVELAKWAQLIVVAPATADTLARLAAGRADDPITATLCCFSGPVLVAPAMHPTMWANPATRRSVSTLEANEKWRIIGPVDGDVASGDRGLGRMSEPEDIAEAVAVASRVAPQRRSLEGKHLVVSAGPTVEPVDPVRFLSNRSSGKMGFAIAEGAARRGARVTLVAGPVSLETPGNVTRVDVRTAEQMKEALEHVLTNSDPSPDALVMTAAVADFRVRSPSAVKLSRSTRDALELGLVPNPDIVAELARSRTGASPHITAFALETGTWEDTLAAARRKLRDKGVDLVVANNAADALEGDATRVAFVTTEGNGPMLTLSKADVADELLDRVTAAIELDDGRGASQ